VKIELTSFITNAQIEFKIPIRYLQEYASLGTGGGIYHFRDLIQSGGPEAFFVINGDTCGDFPLEEMLEVFSIVFVEMYFVIIEFKFSSFIAITSASLQYLGLRRQKNNQLITVVLLKIVKRIKFYIMLRSQRLILARRLIVEFICLNCLSLNLLVKFTNRIKMSH